MADPRAAIPAQTLIISCNRPDVSRASLSAVLWAGCSVGTVPASCAPRVLLRAWTRSKDPCTSALIRGETPMQPESLVRTLEDFLAEAPSAVVFEDGERIFDLSLARYSVSADHGKCLLHLWSDERNTVRRVLDAETKKDALLLSVQRFGQAKPSRLEILRHVDHRSPEARTVGRRHYCKLLQKSLQKQFPDLTSTPLTSAMDLERSFSPLYARGLLRRGRSAFAVFGVNAQELQSSIHCALTFGLLWLEHRP